MGNTSRHQRRHANASPTCPPHRRPHILPDEVVAERVLIDEGGLVRQTGLPRAPERTPRGETAVRWEPGERTTLALAVGGDWRPYDQIVVPVYVPEGQGGALHVAVEMATRTEGLDGNDRYFTHYPLGAAARRGWRGWRDLEYGIENFLIFGIPDAWNGVARLDISLPAPAPEWVLLGPIRLRQRRRPAGPRLTDAGLVAELDLDQPGLEAARAAVDAGDLGAARRALAAHYRARERPTSIYPLPITEPVDLANAERIRAHLILGQQLGRDLDWRANPIGYLEWMHAFNRHYFLQDVIKAYQVTGDERYAAELAYQVSSWIKATPSPLGNDGGGDPAWETLSTAVRCYWAWFDIFYACRRSPHFDDDLLLDLVKSFYHHAEHLLEWGVTKHNNWLVVESQVIASIGVLFPEYRRAAAWRREGYRRLADEIAVQVYPDGTQWELSANYHAMCGQGFASAYELAQLNDIPLPAVYGERLRAMFDHVWRLARPDGSSPSHNDSGSVVGQYQEFVRRGARLFGDPTMAWFASRGAEGAAPAATSHGFVDAGLLVMRSGWERAARWALFDAGPYGAAHQHEDALGLEIYADGTLFLCDPGITSYMREPWFDHQQGTDGHNTILLEGRPQARRSNETREQHVRSVRDEIFWATGAVVDAARARYSAGYRDLAGRFTHERALIFVRPDYWLLFDEVRDEDGGDATRLVESLFHFMPLRLQLDRATGRVRTHRQMKPNLELIPLGPGRAPGTAIVCGRHEPVQGWVSLDKENIPAPCVIFSRRTRLPFRMGLALCPYLVGTRAGVTPRRLRVAGDALAYELRREDGSGDLVCYRWGGAGETRFGGYATDGWLALVRRDARGDDIAAAVAGGTGLTRRGRDLDRQGVAVERPKRWRRSSAPTTTRSCTLRSGTRAFAPCSCCGIRTRAKRWRSPFGKTRRPGARARRRAGPCRRRWRPWAGSWARGPRSGATRCASSCKGPNEPSQGEVRRITLPHTPVSRTRRFVRIENASRV